MTTFGKIYKVLIGEIKLCVAIRPLVNKASKFSIIKTEGDYGRSDGYLCFSVYGLSDNKIYSDRQICSDQIASQIAYTLRVITLLGVRSRLASTIFLFRSKVSWFTSL